MTKLIELLRERAEELRVGAVGLFASGTGIGISLSDVEQWLRISSLVIGIIIGIATLIKLLRGKKA